MGNNETQKYKVEIELLSETTFGSGESQNGVVDQEVLLDKQYYPYMHAKTFKGNLRRVIQNIVAPYCTKKYGDKEFNSCIIKLFGKEGMNVHNNYDSYQKKSFRESKIKFNNLVLSREYINGFNKVNKDLFNNISDQTKLIRQQSKLEVLTNVRYSTKIEDGVAEGKSLRAERVLRKGLIFTTSIDVIEKLTPMEKEILEYGLQALKHLGVKKTRGRGLVKTKFEYIKESDSNKNKIDNNRDFKYILFEFINKQPVKVGTSNHSYDYEDTMDYISGSSIRGAFIGNIIKQCRIKEQELNILLKNVCFYNAYPMAVIDNKTRYLFPMPRCYYTSKEYKRKHKIYTKDEIEVINEQTIIEDNGENKDSKSMICINRLNKENLYTQVNNKDYVISIMNDGFGMLDNDIIKQENVTKENRLHQTSNKNDNNIFRYNAISAGQKFYGIIDVRGLISENNNKILESIKKILRKRVLYLGGSKSSGYGKCEINEVKFLDKLDIYQTSSINNYAKEPDDYFDMYMLSDISVNGLKKIEDEVNEKFGELEIKRTLSKVEISGFNSKWQSKLPMSYYIEKGSVCRYYYKKNSQKENIIDKIRETLDKFLDERYQDGFGKVLLNPAFLNAKALGKVDNNKCEIYNDEINTISSDIKQDVKKRVDLYRNSIFKIKIREYNIKRSTSETDISNAQLSQLLDMVNESMTFVEPLNHFIKSFNDKYLNDKSTNQDRRKRFAKLRKMEVIDCSDKNKKLTLDKICTIEKVDENCKELIKAIGKLENDKNDSDYRENIVLNKKEKQVLLLTLIIEKIYLINRLNSIAKGGDINE